MPKPDGVYGEKVTSYSMVEMLLEETKDYVARFPILTTDRSKKNISTKVKLSDEEKKELERGGEISRTTADGDTHKSTRIFIGNYPPRESLDKQLYIVKINVGKSPSTYFLYGNDQDYNSLKKEFTQRNLEEGKDKDYTIQEIDFNYLKKIIRNEKVEGGTEVTRGIGKDKKIIEAGRYPKLYSVSQIVDGISGIKRKEPDQKEKETKKTGEKEPIDAALELEKKLDKETKIKASGFFSDPENERLLNKIILAHKSLKSIDTKYKKRAEKISDKIEEASKEEQYTTSLNLRDQYTEKLIQNIKKYTDDEKVRESIVNYIIYNRIPAEIKTGLFTYIKTKYYSEEKPGVVVSKDAEVEKPKEKNKPAKEKKSKASKTDITNKEKSSYIVTKVDKEEGEYEEEVKLTDEEYEKIKEEVVKNRKVYDEFINKLDVENIKRQKDPSYIPNIDFSEDFGIIKIQKKRSVQELSSTGTGAQAIPGSGEGMATKYAFKPVKSLTVFKKNKKILDSENYNRLKEEANFIFLETYRGYIKNKKA